MSAEGNASQLVPGQVSAAQPPPPPPLSDLSFCDVGNTASLGHFLGADVGR